VRRNASTAHAVVMCPSVISRGGNDLRNGGSYSLDQYRSLIENHIWRIEVSKIVFGTRRIRQITYVSITDKYRMTQINCKVAMHV